MNYVAIVLLAGLAACSSGRADNDAPGIAGTGTGTTRSFAVTDFTGVELAGSDDVDVRVGSGFSVRAEGPADELDALKIERKGDTLSIGRRHRNGMNWGSHAKVKVFVTLPRLAAAEIAGSGTMAVDRVGGGAFKGEIAGSGDLSIATMAVDKADFDIAGAGNVAAAGSAGELRVEVAGSGDFDAAGLKATRADIDIAGSGNVRATVNGPAKIDILGSGDVDLGPGADCTVSKMGSGDVRCRR